MPLLLLPAGTTTFQVPSDWNNADNVIHCIGGGAGGQTADGGFAGSGGQGGAYAKILNLALSPGANISVHVGFGGAATPMARRPGSMVRRSLRPPSELRVELQVAMA
jgi:hypothetical protein